MANTRARLLLLAAAACLSAAPADASCRSDCRDYCPKDPIFGQRPPLCIEACEAACEAHQTAPGPKPPWPPPPPPIPPLPLACTQAFNEIASRVVLSCMGIGQTPHQARLIDDAVDLLVRARVVSAAEFGDVTIRWCELRDADGMAPDQDVVLLDSKLQANFWSLVSTLAHEMYHQRQYRKMGPARFKCEYSQQYASCFCQDRRHRLEREAYDFQEDAEVKLGALWPAGHYIRGCGCWGDTQGNQTRVGRCLTGWAAFENCSGWCPQGGYPYAVVCR